MEAAEAEAVRRQARGIQGKALAFGTVVTLVSWLLT